MTGRRPLYKKSIKLGRLGEAVMIVRLYATHGGPAQCFLDAVPEARVIPICDVFRYAGLARIIDGPGAGLEAALLGAGEPTF
jgi:hypothetical protein